MKRGVAGLVALSICIAGCQSESDQATEQLETYGESLALAKRAVPAGTEPLQTLGSLELGDDAFGFIEDVVPLEDGRVIVLDSRAQAIKMFDQDGELVSKAGRPGRGPRELFVPRGLALLGGGALAVLDAGNGRVIILETKDSLVISTSFRVPFPAHDICAAGERVYILGFHDDRVIHEMDRTGEFTRSFGQARMYGDIGDPQLRLLTQRAVASGRLMCTTSMVVHLPRLHPDVRAFTVDGEDMWHTKLHEYRQVVIAETERGTVRYGPDPETNGHHLGVGLVSVGKGVVAAQLRHITFEAGEVDDDLPETRFLRLRTGEEIGASSAIPRLEAATGDRLYSVTNLPFPQVWVLNRDRVVDEAMRGAGDT